MWAPIFIQVLNFCHQRSMILRCKQIMGQWPFFENFRCSHNLSKTKDGGYLRPQFLLPWPSHSPVPTFMGCSRRLYPIFNFDVSLYKDQSVLCIKSCVDCTSWCNPLPSLRQLHNACVRSSWRNLGFHNMMQCGLWLGRDSRRLGVQK